MARAGKPAQVQSVNSTFNLTALAFTASIQARALPFGRDGVALNADIKIAGFPERDLLDGLTVGRGVVSSMKRLGRDETSIQISAPVQPGNSGGPAINS
ncbi:trypsin-like peptidase domain-containing protein [Palleronia caenipelagi]|uniref:trypsin-like peptidase domain-containing protein n=1 Tax=Palleronia caenipelagi TaxID=2489174 RepID=UPI00163DB770|nr:trypsin-like peptidase domain-containing protein [Palleronia caenipelagi]